MIMTKALKPGPPPTCLCGACPTCRRRVVRNRHDAKVREGSPMRSYVRHGGPSGAELDKRAAAWCEEVR